MKRAVKNLAISLLGQPLVARLVAATSGPSCVVIMMHRFKRHAADHWGHDPKQLRAVLAALRNAGIALVDLEDAVRAFRSDSFSTISRQSNLSVAFTVDDGYADSYEIAAPIFAEFDCPVTGFVVPGAVEGTTWFWWDKVDFVLSNSIHRKLSVYIGSDVLDLRWSDEQGRRVVHAGLCERLKMQPTELVEPFIRTLAVEAEVDLPDSVPDADRVLRWDELRAAELRGWRFGAHSMTHPVLSRCQDLQSAYEIRNSVEAVQRELVNPSKVFCYPVGRSQDFGARERDLVVSAGLEMAITAIPGVIRRGMYDRHGSNWPLLVPRFSYDARVGGIPRMFLG